MTVAQKWLLPIMMIHISPKIKSNTWCVLELQSLRGENGLQYRVVRYWKEDILSKVWSSLCIAAFTAFELTADFTCFFAIWQFDHFCKLDIDNKQKVISVTAVNNVVHCMRISVISLFSLPACSSSVFVLFTCFWCNNWLFPFLLGVYW